MEIFQNFEHFWDKYIKFTPQKPITGETNIDFSHPIIVPSNQAPIANEPVVPIEEQIKKAKEKSVNTVNTVKPSMGLDSPEVIKAENEVEKATLETQVDNRNAEQNLNNVESDEEKNNNNAQKEVETAQKTAETQNDEANNQIENAQKEADAQVEEAKEHQAQVTDSASESVNNAESEVNNATESQASAQSAFDEAQSALSNAEANLSAAQTALANAPEEEKDTAQARVEAAQQSLEEAKALLETKKSELEQANKALEDAKTNLENVKQESEAAIQEAKDAVNTATQEGAKNVEQAQADAEQVKVNSEKNISSAESNAKIVKDEGEKNVLNAQNNVKDVEAESDKTVESAENELDKAEEVATEEKKPLGVNEIATVLRSNTSSNENFDSEKYQQAIDSLTPENILDYKPNIRAEHRSVEEYNSDMKKVSEALLQKAKELGVDTSDISIQEYREKDRYVLRDGGEKYYTDGLPVYENKEQLEKLYLRCEDAIIANENARFREKLIYNNQEEFVKASVARYEELNGQTKPVNSVDLNFGNGKIDEMSTQETGNCWVEAPLNALASTEMGSNILNSHIYRDDERGITAIHLQEAEDRGLGYNGRGIYTITDKEIVSAQQSISSGDPDATAYNLAFQTFFQEREERYGLSGGYSDRIFEIITGEENNHNQSMDINGIGSSGQTNYEDVFSMAQNGSGATVIYIDETQRSNFWGIVGEGGHALSIVGVTENGELLVQESNNAGMYLSDLPVYSGETYNNAPTYIMDRDTYYNRVLETEHLYWGA